MNSDGRRMEELERRGSELSSTDRGGGPRSPGPSQQASISRCPPTSAGAAAQCRSNQQACEPINGEHVVGEVYPWRSTPCTPPPLSRWLGQAGSCGPAIPATWLARPAAKPVVHTDTVAGFAARARPLKRAVCLAGVAVVTAAPCRRGTHSQRDSGSRAGRPLSGCSVTRRARLVFGMGHGGAMRRGAGAKRGGTRVARAPRVKCTGRGMPDATAHRVASA